MKKILILGANSYIGTSFRKYLTTEYPEQYIVDTVSLRGDAWRRMGWADYDSVINVTGKAHADITTLSDAEKQEYYTVNCELACEAAQKAITDRVKQYVYFSSIIVYGDSSNSRKPVRITADTQPDPSNFYGDSKWQAEHRLTQLFDAAIDGTKLAIIRPPMIYGSGSKGNFQMLKKLAEKLPVFPTYQNERSMLYIENLSEFLRLLVEDCREGVFLPQNPEYVSTADMVFEISDVERKKMAHWAWLNPFVKLAFFFPGKMGKMAKKAFGSMTIDMELSHAVQGYQKYALRESIQRSI